MGIEYSCCGRCSKRWTPTKNSDPSGNECDRCYEKRKELEEYWKWKFSILKNALKTIGRLTIPDESLPYCNEDRIHSIAKEALEEIEKDSKIL